MTDHQDHQDHQDNQDRPISTPAKFELGQLVSTPPALDALDRNNQMPLEFLARHHRGDWGVVDAHDQRANEEALTNGARLFSAYLLKDQTRIWIITEGVGDDGQRASTCILLPEDY